MVVSSSSEKKKKIWIGIEEKVRLNVSTSQVSQLRLYSLRVGSVILDTFYAVMYLLNSAKSPYESLSARFIKQRNSPVNIISALIAQ